MLCLKYQIAGLGDSYHLFNRLPLILNIFLSKTMLLLISRASISNVSMRINYTIMTTTQVVSEEIQAYRTDITNLQFADVPVCQTGPVLLCDVSTGSLRPVMPTQYRRQVFDVMQSLAQPDRKAAQKLLSDQFVWHNMKKYVNKWAKQYSLW